jgi:hypothetical protein
MGRRLIQAAYLHRRQAQRAAERGTWLARSSHERPWRGQCLGIDRLWRGSVDAFDRHACRWGDHYHHRRRPGHETHSGWLRRSDLVHGHESRRNHLLDQLASRLNGLFHNGSRRRQDHHAHHGHARQAAGADVAQRGHAQRNRRRRPYPRSVEQVQAATQRSLKLATAEPSLRKLHAAADGNVRWKTVPCPGWLSTVILPPIRVMSA